MAAAVAELEAGLHAMSALKPPGVSGSRIASLTALCVANVQSESVLIQKIYTHFKKTDGDHKLGVLYVVDSVTRKWLEHAKAQGQAVDGSARDGTFAAGVHRVTELIPVLMNDIIQSAPDSQKEKISKLFDIWEKGQTFPQPLIDSFRAKLSASTVKSTTPDGSPPPGLMSSLGYGGVGPTSMSATPATSGTPPVPAPASNSNAIMEALANIARQNVATGSGNGQPAAAPPAPPAPPAAPVPAPAPAQPPAATDLSRLLQSISQHQPAAPSTNSPVPSYPVQQQPAPALNVPGMPFPFPPGATPAQVPHVGGAPTVANGSAGGYTAPAPTPPSAVGSVPGLNPEVQQQVVLIKALADQGVPLDKIPALVQTLQAAGMIQPASTQPVPPAQAPYGAAQSWSNAPAPVTGTSRDYSGYGQGRRSPDRSYGRSRSRSPGGRWDSRDPYRGGRDGPDRRFDDHGSGRNGRGSSEFRQRSPASRRGRSPSPTGSRQHNPQTEKWVEYDRTLPQDHIRVYSRTLFVGGVTCTEQELRSIFDQHGEVQTCIVNRDKRHAFVKMVTRKDAEAAKRAMERQHSVNGHQLRTRWGVGFGPRDCSDYSTGISVIPISSLTEADRKWMLTAEYGGSGGRPLEGGLVVEEPDIEIGAGVSSKAISRRMQTDKGGSQGPKSTRSSEDRWRRGGKDRGDDVQSQLSGANAQPLPQKFPYGISTMANGMPSFPPGFSFPPPDGQGGAASRP
ncbi:hypothetical protein ACRALDRAFT_1082769 [Sodiomyces alcalophilus JCM 7366]|uniref:uncharacterized protein n=1 Tax=Sodiomyces alcalophilus JCM 7366 TaxID=591952 RepID=UPI0039B5A4D0